MKDREDILNKSFIKISGSSGEMEKRIISIYESLLNAGANPNFLGKNHESLLSALVNIYIFSQHCSKSLFLRLGSLILANGGDPNLAMHVDVLAILEIIDNVNITKNRLKDVLKDCNFPERTNLTPLSTAVLAGKIEVVALLLEHGANPYIDFAGIQLTEITELCGMNDITELLNKYMTNHDYSECVYPLPVGLDSASSLSSPDSTVMDSLFGYHKLDDSRYSEKAKNERIQRLCEKVSQFACLIPTMLAYLSFIKFIENSSKKNQMEFNPAIFWLDHYIFKMPDDPNGEIPAFLLNLIDKTENTLEVKAIQAFYARMYRNAMLKILDISGKALLDQFLELMKKIKMQKVQWPDVYEKALNFFVSQSSIADKPVEESKIIQLTLEFLDRLVTEKENNKNNYIIHHRYRYVQLFISILEKKTADVSLINLEALNQFLKSRLPSVQLKLTNIPCGGEEVLSHLDMVDPSVLLSVSEDEFDYFKRNVNDMALSFLYPPMTFFIEKDKNSQPTVEIKSRTQFDFFSSTTKSVAITPSIIKKKVKTRKSLVGPDVGVDAPVDSQPDIRFYVRLANGDQRLCSTAENENETDSNGKPAIRIFEMRRISGRPTYGVILPDVVANLTESSAEALLEAMSWGKVGDWCASIKKVKPSEKDLYGENTVLKVKLFGDFHKWRFPLEPVSAECLMTRGC